MTALAPTLQTFLTDYMTRQVAVGTGLRFEGSARPPHRSQRAELPHWAPRLSDGVEPRTPAIRRMRTSALSAPCPALSPGRVLLAAFPSRRPLPSSTSAAAIAALFGTFTGTMSLSDFPGPFIEGVPPKRSPRVPPPTDLPPREPSKTGHHRQTRATLGSPGSQHEEIAHMPGSPTPRGPLTARENAASDVAFRRFRPRRHPGQPHFEAQ